jgi:crotonobetainyl-CoA:carnitine CoA-transferase CaiB-like acyl-CoA transferase
MYGQMSSKGCASGPLAGIRVISVEQYGAGPWGTLQLADLGADVVKVEDPASGGDVGRYVPPYQQDEDSLFFEAFNRGKRSVSLDLRSEAGRTVLHRLVAGADAVFSNLRGDQPARLGLTYAALAPVNPRIVCCSLSGFGQTGPRAAQGAYDYVIQGLAGWMSMTGEPDAPPTKSGLSLVDFAGGYVAALSMLAGLWRARETGEGCDCDLSLLETALALTNYVGTWAATAGYEPQRISESAHPSIVPFQNFPTRDGWIVVACPKEKLWRAFCTAIGEPEMPRDERFASFAARGANRDVLVAKLREVLLTRTTSAWLQTLTEHGVPCAPVNDLAGALADPQVVARGGVVESAHPRLGTVRHIASPLRVGGAVAPPLPAPARGEHTRAVLRECGCDEALIDELEGQGAFGEPPRQGRPSAARPPSESG